MTGGPLTARWQFAYWKPTLNPIARNSFIQKESGGVSVAVTLTPTLHPTLHPTLTPTPNPLVETGLEAEFLHRHSQMNLGAVVVPDRRILATKFQNLLSGVSG